MLPIFKRNISFRTFPHPSCKGINLLLLIMNTGTFFSQVDLILCLHDGLWRLILQVEAIKKPCLNYLHTICQEYFVKISVLFWSPGEISSTLEPDLGILGKQHGRCQTTTFKNYIGNYRIRLLQRNRLTAYCLLVVWLHSVMNSLF